ncbi:hypothetical protein N9C96_02695, partial [bacterium]|nr:hypothetical protein [bacterium]
IAKMGLKEARSSDVAGTYHTSDYFRLRTIMALVAIVLMVAAGFTQADTTTILVVISIYGLTRVVELIVDIIHAHFILVERMDYAGKSLCISGPLALAALAIGYYISGSLIVAVTGQLLAQLAVLVFYDLPLSKRIGEAKGEDDVKLPWNLPKIRRLARLAIPLAVGTAMIVIGQYLPRLWVGAELGLVALGIFGPILAMAMAPDRLVNSMCLAMSVRLAHDYADGRRDLVFRRLFQVAGALLVLGLPAVAVCYYYGDEILTTIYSEDFAGYGTLLVCLAAAGLTRIIANVLAFGLIASRQFWWITLQNAGVAVAALLGCYFLIGPYGLAGAGWCMVLIFGTQLVLVLVGLLAIPAKPAEKAE